MHEGNNNIDTGLFHFGGPRVGMDNTAVGCPRPGASCDMEGADTHEHIEAGSPEVRAIFAEEEADVALTSSLTS